MIREYLHAVSAGRKARKLRREGAKWYAESLQLKRDAEKMQISWPQYPDDALYLLKDAVYLMDYSRKCFERASFLREIEHRYRTMAEEAWMRLVGRFMTVEVGK